MNIDFENALTFISKDPEWNGKLLAGAGLMLLSFVVFIFPIFGILFDNILLTLLLLATSLVIYAVCQFVILGYGCECANRLIENKEETILPNWKNFRHLMFLGFKYSIGSFLLISPIFIIYVAGLGAIVLSSLITNEAVSTIAIMLSTMLILLLIGIGLLFYFFILAFLPLMSANFMKELRISSFINLKQAFKLVKGHGLDYLILYLLFLALACIIGTIASVLVFTIIGLLFIPILYFYGFLVYANLCAQFVNLSNNKKEEIQAVQE